MIERGTNLQNFEILDVQIVYVFLFIGTLRTVLFKGGGDCDVLDSDPVLQLQHFPKFQKIWDPPLNFCLA